MFAPIVFGALTMLGSAASCGEYNGHTMAIDKKFNKHKIDAQVMNIWGDWSAACSACGEYLEKHGKLCPGWYCKNTVFWGMYLKRDGERCNTPAPTPAPKPKCANVEVTNCKYGLPKESESKGMTWNVEQEACNAVEELKMSSKQAYKQSVASEETYRLTNSVQDTFEQSLGIEVAAEATVTWAVVSATLKSKVTSNSKWAKTTTATTDSFKRTETINIMETSTDIEIKVPAAYVTKFSTTATRLKYDTPYTCKAVCKDGKGKKIGTTDIKGTVEGFTYENVKGSYKTEYCGPCMEDQETCNRDECDAVCEAATCGGSERKYKDEKGWYCQVLSSNNYHEMCICGKERDCPECLNNGVSVGSMANADCQCLCALGWTGTHCETALEGAPTGKQVREAKIARLARLAETLRSEARTGSHL